MKKRLAVLLAMGMAMTMTTSVFAATDSTKIDQNAEEKNQTVVLTYEQPETYTVTIPADVKFASAQDATKSLEISASNVVIKYGKSLNVAVSSANYDSVGTDKWRLKDGSNDNYLKYTLMKDQTVVDNGAKVLTVESGTPTGTTTLKLTGPEAAAKAGTYTDTLTFAVSLE